MVQKESDLRRRATAYAALTLSRVLASEWTHVLRDKSGACAAVVKPAGILFGERAELERRLARLAWELR